MKKQKKSSIQSNQLDDSLPHKLPDRKKFVITKKIAKHGSQAIIVIPRMLEKQLKPGTIAQVTLDILEEVEDNAD